MSGSDSRRLVWRQLRWPRPLDAGHCLSLLRRLAADERSPHVVLEARSLGRTVEYFVGAAPAAMKEMVTLLSGLVPGTVVTEASVARPSLDVARQVTASTRHRPLRTDDLDATTRTLLSALAVVRHSEAVVIQLVLGPRRVPLAVPTNSPSSTVAPWWMVVWHGNGQTLDSEKRTALRTKVGDHGFACALRIGATAASDARRRSLILGVAAAMRTAELSGLRLKTKYQSVGGIERAVAPWLGWPLQLNVKELLTFTAWPIGGDDLPGLAAAHPKRLPPPVAASQSGRIVADSLAPGVSTPLRLGAKEALHHTHVIGPTGVGKSVLLARLIEQDIADGRAVVVIDPKGDLVDDVLAHLPVARRGDVVLLDPTDTAPVGLNPLTAHGQKPEVVAEGLVTILRSIYADSWGPRTQDVLHAGLLTLAKRGDASLVMLPMLFTNVGFRRSLTQHLDDPLALEPFWAWFDGLSEAERGAVLAPVMNKLRPWLLNPALRAVLGQRQPAFDLSEVFTKRRILLVPLRSGIIGREAARLLGTMLVAQLWHTVQARTAVPTAKRHPVMIFIDEVQDYLRLPTDLGDALAQARGLGVAFTLAHQFLGQLSPDLRAGVLSNARSRICFQLSHDDAVTLAKGHPELGAEDFIALGRYEVYASLFADGRVTPYALGTTRAASPETTDPQAVRLASRDRYGRPLNDIEAGFTELLKAPTDEPVPGRRRRS